MEEETGKQLGLDIELEFPASLENEALSEKPSAEERGAEQEQAIQPKDTSANMEGRK